MAPTTFGRPKGQFEFRLGIEHVFPNRPSLAVQYAAAVSFWSYVESWYANLQTTLRLDFTLDDLARFQKMRNSKRHIEELRKSAQATLAPEHLALFETTLQIAIEPAPERNDLVHGLSITVNTMPDAILVLRPEHMQTLVFRTFVEILRSGRHPPGLNSMAAECMSPALIYRKADFEDLLRRINRSERLMFYLWQLCTRDKSTVEVAEHALGELLRS